MDRHTFFLDSATETLVQSRHQPFPMERMEWAERLDFDGSPLQSAIQLSSSIVPHVILRTEFWFLGYALIVGFLIFFSPHPCFRCLESVSACILTEIEMFFNVFLSYSLYHSKDKNIIFQCFLFFFTWTILSVFFGNWLFFSWKKVYAWSAFDDLGRLSIWLVSCGKLRGCSHFCRLDRSENLNRPQQLGKRFYGFCGWKFNRDQRSHWCMIHWCLIFLNIDTPKWRQIWSRHVLKCCLNCWGLVGKDYYLVVSEISKMFSCLPSKTWRNGPIWLMFFFKWVETTT